MIYFFQKNRKIFSAFNYTSIKEHFNSLRRFDYIYISEFSNQIVYIWMIAFAIRIGSLLFFMFSNFMSPQLAYALEDVKLPSAVCIEKIENKRLYIYLTVHSDESLILNGRKIDKNDLEAELKRIREQLPSLVITIAADKNCRMELITECLRECKKALTTRVFFLTNTLKSSQNITSF